MVIRQMNWIPENKPVPPLPPYLAFFENLRGECVECGVNVPRDDRRHCRECFDVIWIQRKVLDFLVPKKAVNLIGSYLG